MKIKLKKSLKQTIFGVLSFLVLLTSCTREMEDSPTAEVRFLVDEFSKNWLQSGIENLVFHDPVLKNRHLGTGWILDTDLQKTRFPWPRFTKAGGVIHLNWNQRLERRVKIRLMNVKHSYPKNLIAMELNGKPVSEIEGQLPFGEFEFFLPATYQRVGQNKLLITLNQNLFQKAEEYNSVGLHSVSVTLGAVVRNSISIGNELRNSLLFAPPVSLQIPYIGTQKHTLQFSYGLYSLGSESENFQYALQVNVYENIESRPVFRKEISVTTNEDQTGEWHNIQLQLPALSDSGFIEFSFKSKDMEPIGMDYLALSEIFLQPSQKNWTLGKGDPEPDLLLFTLSSTATSQLGVYGDMFARTPFIDYLSRQGITHNDVTSASNGQKESLWSIATGKYPRDHGIFRSQTVYKSKFEVIPEVIENSNYQSHGIVHTQSTNFTPIRSMNGFRRLYLSDASKSGVHQIDKSFIELLQSPYLRAKPAFTWVHIDPKLVFQNKLDMFPPDNYGIDEYPVTSLNLPISEQQRLLSYCNEDEGEDIDLRTILSANDRRVYEIDKVMAEIVQTLMQRRQKRSLIVVVTADHGIIRSLKSNPLSDDSLSQEVIQIPLIITKLTKTQNSSQEITQRLSTSPVSSTKIFDVIIGLVRSGDINSINQVINPPVTNRTTISSIFSEHSFRPIVAYRKGPNKLIHCLSDPYFQIATTNLFNLEKNPSETINEVGKDPDLTRQLLSPVMAFCRGSRFYPEPRPGLEDEALEILKSLNYTVEKSE